MQKKWICGLMLCAFFLCVPIPVSSSSSGGIASCQHKTRKKTENFLPYGRLNLTPVFIGECSAAGILGEIGHRTYRINGTYGLFYCNHRIKIGGEYLGQQLRHKFLTGESRRWVQQYALGGKYQYWLRSCGCLNGFFQGFELSGYYSCAKHHSPHSIFCSSQNVTVFRRILGGRQWNAEGGLIIGPWPCATLIGTVGYDEFMFRHHFNHQRRYSGASGSLYFKQRLFQEFALDLKAEFRRLYNYLEGMLSWNSRFYYGEVTLGVFGSHTWGKNRLPNVSTVGGELRFAFGIDKRSCQCSCNPCCDDTCPSEIAEWVASPAVYTPQVFAIGRSTVCEGPISIPFPQLVGGENFDLPLGFTTINLATNFIDPNGRPLTFVSSRLPEGVSLQPNGILFINNDGLHSGEFEITITASSDCGTTSQPVILTIEGGE